MIVKVGKKYVVKSHDGRKTLSRPYNSKAEAVKRFREIEAWKCSGVFQGQVQITS